MMLRYDLGREKEADALEAAVSAALDKGYRTADIYDESAKLLYEADSPFAAAGRALVRGRRWDYASGKLVASTVQEGVFRVESRL